MADSNASEDSQTRGEGLKMILECVEDLQADLSGVETEDKSLIENFVEEIQVISCLSTSWISLRLSVKDFVYFDDIA